MNKDVRWQQRFNNYVKALRLLERVSEDVSIAEETGMLATIQAFEMVLELSWNLLKDKMSHDGLTFQPVPKTVYREAFNKGYIDDAQVWLAAIEKRNLSSHTYNEEVAKELWIIYWTCFYLPFNTYNKRRISGLQRKQNEPILWFAPEYAG